MESEVPRVKSYLGLRKAREQPESAIHHTYMCTHVVQKIKDKELTILFFSSTMQYIVYFAHLGLDLIVAISTSRLGRCRTSSLTKFVKSSLSSCILCSLYWRLSACLMALSNSSRCVVSALFLFSEEPRLMPKSCDSFLLFTFDVVINNFDATVGNHIIEIEAIPRKIITLSTM